MNTKKKKTPQEKENPEVEGSVKHEESRWDKHEGSGDFQDRRSGTAGDWDSSPYSSGGRDNGL